MKNINKFFILILTSSLIILSSCTNTSINNNSGIDESALNDIAPDVKTIYAQACLDENSQCMQLLCEKEDSKFICTDSISGSNSCSPEKNLDEIVNNYKICSDNEEVLEYSLFNYSEGKNKFFETMTPKEIEDKINEELKIVEEGGSSDFLKTLLAAAGGSLIGGAIANSLFGAKNAQVPQTNIENNRTLDKQSLNNLQEKSKTETQLRNETREQKRQELKNKVDQAKKQINNKQTTPTSTKKSFGKRR